jgi:hypothetical protein
MLRRMLIALLTLVILVGAVQIVTAQDDDLVPVESEDYGIIQRFDDGRLNAFDLDAPVAIYYDYRSVPHFTGGPGTEVLRAVEIWAYDPETETSQQVIYAPILDIRADTPDRVDDPFVVNGGAFQLHRALDGRFIVTAPGYDGATYTFEWYDVLTR